MHVGLWDVLLLVVVSLMCTMIAYIHNARLKALVLMFPIPFTFASLSLGQRIDVTNILGLPVLYLFAQGVRILHKAAGVNIIAAIVLSTVTYCLLGWGLAAVIPRSEIVFWVVSIAVLLLGLGIHFISKDVDEPGHTSSLSLWRKLTIITIVICILVMIKTLLQGFMTVFPMVGIIALYETRHSLATTCRKIGDIILTVLPMMAVMRICQVHFDMHIGQSLLFGWIALVIILPPFIFDMRRKNGVGVKECVGKPWMTKILGNL